MAKSEIPHHIFSCDLETQRQELKENAIIQRMAEGRKNHLEDRYYPRYHFAPPELNLNDPNGLCFWKGNWHLFYQASPVGSGRVHWGHAISKDLVHWEDLPYAVYPDKEEHSYSGSCFVEEDRVVAAHYGCRGESGIYVKTSSDPLLLNWEDVSDSAVIPTVDFEEYGQPYQIYDPCIWKDGDCYYILSGGWADGLSPLSMHYASQKTQGEVHRRCRPTDYLFASKDLKNWEYRGEFIEGNMFGASGDDGSCPYFWPIGEKHILLTFSHMHSAMYIIGQYDHERQRLVAHKGGRLNTGPWGSGSIHAPSAYPDGKGGVNCIYNVNGGLVENNLQTMSLMRNYTLGENDRLLIKPAGDIESLRKNPVELSNVALPANKEIVINEVRGDTMEIIASIDPGESKFISLNVLRSPDKSEYTSINFYKYQGDDFNNQTFDYDARDSLVTIDPSFASTAPPSKVGFKEIEKCNFKYNDGELLELRIFIDRSIVEVFVNGQSASLLRVYPENIESLGFSMLSRGADAACKKLRAYEMKCIYV